MNPKEAMQSDHAQSEHWVPQTHDSMHVLCKLGAHHGCLSPCENGWRVNDQQCEFGIF